MESRLERYLKEKETKKNKRRKFMVVLILIIILFISINIVNGTLVNYFGLNDMNVFNYEFQEDVYDFQILGRNYQINRGIVENIIITFSGSVERIKDYVEGILK